MGKIGLLDLSIILSYLFLVLVVGVYKGRHIKGTRDFCVANNIYTTPVLVCTMAATLIGADVILGMTEKVISVGIIFILLFLTSPLGKIFLAECVAPYVYRFQGCLSVGEIMEKQYGKLGRVSTGIAGTFISIGEIGAQLYALGYFFNFFLGLPYAWGVIIGAGIVVIYSTFGGIKAVVATDIIQFLILIVGIPIICNTALSEFGGYIQLLEKLPQTHQRLLPEGQSWLPYIYLFIVFPFPFLNPAVMQRLLMVKNIKQAQQMLRVTALMCMPLYLLIGLTALIAMIKNPAIEPQMAFPYLIDVILPAGIKGIAITGILAVVMSTADSYLNVASISLIHDLFVPLRKNPLTDQQEVTLMKWATFTIGTLAIIAAISFQSIVDMLLTVVEVWGAVILVPLYSFIWGIKANQKCFIWGAVLGLMANIFWKFLNMSQLTGIGDLFPSILLNMIGFFGIYFFEKALSKRTTLI